MKKRITPINLPDFKLDSKKILTAQEITHKVNEQFGQSYNVEPKTGYSLSAAQGAIGGYEIIGRRGMRSSGGGQQDLLTMGYTKPPSESKMRMDDYFENETKLANGVVQEMEKKQILSTKCTGATLTEVGIIDGQLWCSSMGDGAAYLIIKENSEYTITRLNEPDNLSNDDEVKRIKSEYSETKLKYDKDYDDVLDLWREYFSKPRDSKEFSEKYLEYRNYLKTIPSKWWDNIKRFANNYPDRRKEEYKFLNIYFKHKLKHMYNPESTFALNVTAGFGDLSFPSVRHTPKITQCSYPKDKPCWIVVGCDGYVENLKDIKQIKNVIQTVDQSEGSTEKMAVSIGDMALENNSNDNISVVVAALNQLPKNKLTKIVVLDAHGLKGDKFVEEVGKVFENDFLKPNPKMNNLKTELETYMRNRSVEKGEYYHCCLFGYSKTIKLGLVEKILKYIDGFEGPLLTQKEVDALQQDNLLKTSDLAKIYFKYQDLFDDILQSDPIYEHTRNVQRSYVELIKESTISFCY